MVGTRVIANCAQGGPTGLVGASLELLRTEGVGAFYKGFVPNFARIGSFNVVMWMTFEQLRGAITAATEG